MYLSLLKKKKGKKKKKVKSVLKPTLDLETEHLLGVLFISRPSDNVGDSSHWIGFFFFFHIFTKGHY